MVSAVRAQIGGKNAFEFLNVPAHARLAGLGSVNVSRADADVNFFINNPALAGDTLAGMASASYLFYPGNVGQALIAYGHSFSRAGTWYMAVQHLDYGTLQGYDETGNETGEFEAGETAVILSRSHSIRHFRLGFSAKALFSNVAGYRATAMSLDIGGLFQHPEKEFTAGLVIKNLGMVFSEYTRSTQTRLPFDVQAGVTFKPEHMPLRFSLTAFNLPYQNTFYADPDDPQEKPGAFQKILNHTNLGVEVLIHRNVTILTGYNSFIRQSHRLEERAGGAGLSLGLVLSLQPVQFIVSRSGYVTGNAGYSFTLSSRLTTLLTRRKL